MLCGDSFTSSSLDPLLCNIAQSNHADRLPNAQPDAGGDTPVKPLDAVLAVNVLEGPAHIHVLGAVGVLLLALHLDADNLDGLVPSGETAADGGRADLLDDAELLAALLVGHLADTVFGDAGQAEAGAPVGDLAHGDGVDAPVDALDALGAVDVHERLHGARGLDPGRRHLVLCDFHRLHAGAETHCCVGLGETTDHSSADSADERRGAGGAGVVLGFGGDEEEDGALARGFDPCPGNETLVDCEGFVSVAGVWSCGQDKEQSMRGDDWERLTAKDTATAPDAGNGACHAVGAVCCHGSLDDFQRLSCTLAPGFHFARLSHLTYLAKRGDLEQVQASAHCDIVSTCLFEWTHRRRVKHACYVVESPLQAYRRTTP